jgi:FecR protein
MSELTNDLDRLIALHLDDALDAPSAERLFALLGSDVAARRLLLSAATQATVFPREALEAGLARPPAVAKQQRPARWWWSAVAAALLLGVSLWWTLRTDTLGDVRLAARADLVVVRDGERTAAQSSVQAGDRLEVGASVARLDWTSEGTGIDLDVGARVVIEQLGVRKRLRLERGTLTAEVAPQGGGGLSVTTPFGVVDVVGTRFRVQVDDVACAVQVEHGAVRVSGAHDPTPVTVGAGFAVRLAADGQRSAPAPLTSLPTNAPATGTESPARSTPARVVRLGVETYRASDGWEGDLIDGTIRGRAVAGSPVTRITTPLHRPDGVERFDAALRVTIDLTVDHPTTLAVLLVCDHPDGGARWLANVQAERRIPAGTQQVTFRAEDFVLTTAGPQPLPGSRIAAVAVMTWLPAADLRLRSLQLAR